VAPQQLDPLTVGFWKFCDADLSGAHLEGANLFKAVLDGANFAEAFLAGAQFLNCAQLIVTWNWQAAFRDETLACGAAIPGQESFGIDLEVLWAVIGSGGF